MNDWDYSNEALNVKSAFHQAKHMLYVEGEDDEVFWELILETFDIEGYKIQAVNGVSELKKYISKILDNQIDDFAARDVDFIILDKNWKKHPKILMTYAHSIENTLINSNTLFKIIRAYGRFKAGEVNRSDCSDWLDVFNTTFNDLVLYDAINELHSKGITVLSNNCSKFMTSQTSHKISETKIEHYITDKNLVQEFSEYLEDIKDTIETVEKQVFDFMRGHFLFSGARKFINYKMKALGSSKTISDNSLFSNAILVLENSFNSEHPHYEYYEEQIQKLLVM